MHDGLSVNLVAMQFGEEESKLVEQHVLCLTLLMTLPHIQS